MGFPSEAELLLCCARTRLSETTTERVRALAREGIDWQAVLSMARRHGVMPLLYRQLKAIGPHEIPPPVSTQLDLDFGAHALWNFRLVQELVQLLHRLAEQGICAIPFKGPVQALWIYGDLLLRKCGDLDILISPREILPAKELILSLGYELVTPQREDGLPSQLGKHEYRFLNPKDQLSVELRWRLASRPLQAKLSFGHLWERCQSTPLFGATAARLTPEDLLLVLCWHGSQHCWDRLMWVCDIAELVRRHPDLDWERVRDLAGSAGCRRMLALGLLLGRNLLGMELPEAVRRDVASDITACALAKQVAFHLFDGAGCFPIIDSRDSADGGGLPLPERRRYYTQMIEWLPDRIQYQLQPIRHWITPNARDRALLPLPEPLSFLYYLLRPVRLTREYGWRRIGAERRPQKKGAGAGGKRETGGGIR